MEVRIEMWQSMTEEERREMVQAEVMNFTAWAKRRKRENKKAMSALRDALPGGFVGRS